MATYPQYDHQFVSEIDSLCVCGHAQVAHFGAGSKCSDARACKCDGFKSRVGHVKLSDKAWEQQALDLEAPEKPDADV